MVLLDVRCYYTNSQVVLYWIRGKDKKWKPFVQNGVRDRMFIPIFGTIVQEKNNPTHLPSRRLNIQKLSVIQLWRAGPEWLRLDTRMSSELEAKLTCMPELCLPELKANSKLSHSLLAIERRPDAGDVMSCADFSSLKRLVRVTSYVLRAVNRFKAKKSNSDLPTTLTYQEIATSEKLWITHALNDLVLQKDFKALKCQFGLFL